MPLLNANEIMRWAVTHRRAVAAFNVDTLETMVAIERAAERLAIPMFLQVTTATLDIWGWRYLFDQLAYVARHSPVNITIQLDHATDVLLIERALSLGFPSIMYDGSHLPFRENVNNTLRVIQMARPVYATVEAEIGHVSRAGEPSAWYALTTLEDAHEFLSLCSVDLLAVSVGTVHGQNRHQHDIDIDRVRTLHKHLPHVPLVLHGGSGVPPEILTSLVDAGIRKVNVGTELRRIWLNRVAHTAERKPREVVAHIMEDSTRFAEQLMLRLTGQASV